MHFKYYLVDISILVSISLLITLISGGNFLLRYIDNLFLISLIVFNIGLFRWISSKGFFDAIRDSFKRVYRKKTDFIDDELEELSEDDEDNTTDKYFDAMLPVSFGILLLFFLTSIVRILFL